jgi:dTDP-4-amino-4,6-dideoxygalactose transaminase
MRDTFLPFALPDVGEEEIAAVAETIRSGWITTGARTKRFEREFAAYVGAKHAIAVNSCTAALHLALETVGIQPGDEIITTPLTFAATAEVIRYFDAKPVFVDIERDTMNIDASRIEAAISPRTRAIVPVHVAGFPCDMARILEVAHGSGIAVIEDAAHALPTRIGDRLVGAFSDATCFSFYATKTLTTGEGGMICTDRDEIAERCRIMSLHGISRDAWKRYTAEGSWYYEITAPGYKYNLTDIAAAMGLVQLAKVNQMWLRRQTIADRYDAAFRDDTALEIPFRSPMTQHAWHLYPIRLNLGELRIDRADIIAELRKRQIGTSVHFIPLHVQPYYRDLYGYRPDDFPIAYAEYRREISLPIYSSMSNEDVENVIESLSEVVELNRL